MHIIDKNYIALFDHGIKMLVTYQLYILDPRFVPRLCSIIGLHGDTYMVLA